MARYASSGTRLTFMNPITKVIIACTTVCVVLYMFIGEFLGGTDELRDTLDATTALPRALEDDPEEALGQPVTLQGEQLDQQDVRQVLSDDTELASEMSSAEVVEALMKETLGINALRPPVRAVDVSYELPPNCEASAVALAPVAVQYRYESPTIKGASLNELEILMTEYRRCEGGAFQFGHNPLGKEDATPLLMQMRLDELKYFFLQHRVPKTALKFPDDS